MAKCDFLVVATKFASGGLLVDSDGVRMSALSPFAHFVELRVLRAVNIVMLVL